MDKRIKAIETRYKGYRFRSRLEARWAVFFDALGLKWDYEVEGFEFEGGLRYLPDFYLPDWDIFIEVKPDLPECVDMEEAAMIPFLEAGGKLTDLAKFLIASRAMQKKEESGAIKPRLFMLCGSPAVPKIRQRQGMWSLKDGAVLLAQICLPVPMIHMELRAWSDSVEQDHLDIWPLYTAGTSKIGAGALESYAYPKGTMMRGYIGKGRRYDTKRLTAAYNKARSARFEFGESP